MRKALMLLVTSLMLLLILLVPPVRSQGTRGPIMDVLRLPVIRGPEAKRIALLTEMFDVWPSMTVPMDVYSSMLAETNGNPSEADLWAIRNDPRGFLVTEDAAFHVANIGFNIRDTATIQSYYRPGITYWPLHDVEFRHALIHCYNQSGIVADLYEYTASPVRSKVPPAQSKYYDFDVPEHPYNPGDPFAMTFYPADHSSCGILRAAGYTFVDAGTTGVVDDADYWKMPNGDPLDEYVIWTPLVNDAPTSYEHVARFVEDLGSIGLAATAGNGWSGLINQGAAFNWYLQQVYDFATFDAFMVCENFGRLPEQL
ncbi:MAG: hypothetical protein GTO14_00425, partial [Anaerolineales bacterium]|nr:hypothetical protein [Anaerolineales bacterium]